jgi:hypothetical protein
MAIEDVLPRLVARAAMVLRANAIMPRLISNDYATSLAEEGNTVDVKKTKARTAERVVPANNPSGFQQPNPETVPVTLSEFFHSGFALNDNIITGLESNSDYVPTELEECVIAVANEIDQSILRTAAAGTWTRVGAAGTTPFSANTLVEARNARRELSRNLCPVRNGGLSLVLDVDGYSNAIGVPTLQRVDQSGASRTLREGEVGRALGFDWHEDQNILQHTTGASGPAYAVNNAAGYDPAAIAPTEIHSITIDDGAGATPGNEPVPGDLFNFAGHAQNYVVTEFNPLTNQLSFMPSLKAALADNEALTFVPSHVKNLAFHRSSMAFASRLQMNMNMNGVGGGGQVMASEQIADPISGVALRVELIRGYKQTIIDVDALWGVSMIQGECAAIVMG